MILLMPRALLLAVLASCFWLRPVLAAVEEASLATPAPAGIAVDADSNVYVSDYALDRVVKFGPDGSVVAQWGGTGSGPGQFNAPFGVSIDASNTIFVVDQLNNRLQRFATDGTLLSAWGGSWATCCCWRVPTPARRLLCSANLSI